MPVEGFFFFFFFFLRILSLIILMDLNNPKPKKVLLEDVFHILFSNMKLFFCFFISGNFYFSFVSTSLAYITIPQNKRKIEVT